MKSLLCVLALCLATIASPCLGKEPGKADAAYGVKYAQEQVVSLPQDQDKPYITVFGHPNDPRFNQVVGWFESNPTLKSLKDQSHFNAIHTTSSMFAERYAANTRPVLMVRMQAAGVETPVAELEGNAVPLTADALARHLNAKAGSAECFRNWCKPKPKPDETKKDPPAQPLPPAGPAKPKQREMPTWPLALAVILSALGGGGYSFYKQMAGEKF